MEVKDFCTGIQHIGIPTNDISETIRFYEMLGFTVAHRADNNGEAVAFLKLHNLIIETYENKAAVMYAGAIDHIAIDVKHIDQLFALLQTKGVKMLDQQVNGLPFWERGVRFFTIEGPNCEKVEFCEKL